MENTTKDAAETGEYRPRFPNDPEPLIPCAKVDSTESTTDAQVSVAAVKTDAEK